MPCCLPPGLASTRRTSPRARTQLLPPCAAYSPPQWNAELRALTAKGCPVYNVGTRFLTVGDHGDDVKELQRFLMDAGYFDTKYGLTGYMGNVTKASLEAWQKDNAVPSTGAFGDLSRAKLLQICAKIQGKKVPLTAPKSLAGGAAAQTAVAPPKAGTTGQAPSPSPTLASPKLSLPSVSLPKLSAPNLDLGAALESRTMKAGMSLALLAAAVVAVRGVLSRAQRRAAARRAGRTDGRRSSLPSPWRHLR